MTEKKGTLRHKGTGREIEEVVLVREDRDYLSVRLVPEAQQRNNFPVEAWEFVQTVKPLPETSDTLTILAGGYYPMVRVDGKKWYQVTWASPEFTMNAATEQQALYRLGLAGSRLFEGTRELNREDYIQ